MSNDQRPPYPDAMYPSRVRPFVGDLVQVFMPGEPLSRSAVYHGGFCLPKDEQGLVRVVPSEDVLGWCFGGALYGSTDPLFSNPFHKP